MTIASMASRQGSIAGTAKRPDMATIERKRIYVVCPDKMCFYVDAVTLDPESCSFYDPYWNAPYAPQPQMSHGEWTSKHMPMLIARYLSSDSSRPANSP